MTWTEIVADKQYLLGCSCMGNENTICLYADELCSGIANGRVLNLELVLIRDKS